MWQAGPRSHVCSESAQVAPGRQVGGSADVHVQHPAAQELVQARRSVLELLLLHGANARALRSQHGGRSAAAEGEELVLWRQRKALL